MKALTPEELAIEYLRQHHSITEATIGLVDTLLRDGECLQASESISDGIRQLEIIANLYRPATSKPMSKP